MRHALRSSLIVLLGWLASSQATAGVIRGTIRPAQTRATKAAAKGAGRIAKPARDAISCAVVYLEAIPDKLEKKLASKATAARMGQAYGHFVPSPLPIAAGTTVEFENQDRVYHSVFSVSPVKRFDAGKYAPRESRRVRFDKPGEIKLFCDIDPGETGTVFVTPNHAFTQPDPSGAFELPKLPAGKYQLRVWSPGRRLTRDIEMPRKGDVTVDLTL